MTAPTPDLLDYLDLEGERLERENLTEDERQVLDEINERVAAQQSTEAIIDFLFERTRAICPGDRISVAFVEETGLRLVSHYTRATYEPLVLKQGYAEDLRGSSLEAVIATGRVRVIHDLERYLEAHPASRSTRVLLREGVRSSLTCPLQVEGRVVGALFRSARSPRAYDRRHAHLHAVVASRLSQAIEKTYRLEQLAAANLAYGEMLGFVSHELKSPVASMVTSAQLLRDGYVGPMSEQQRDVLERIVTKGDYLLGLVRDYLELARLEGEGLRYEPRRDVSFETNVLAIAMDVVRSEAAARRIRIEQEVDVGGPVTLDASLMRIVLVNLLTNAVKYGRDGGLVQVTARRADSALEIAVYNEGPGFSAEERSLLFKKFSRLRRKEFAGIKGSGVGLYTVWRIVQLHGGRIAAHSEPGAWARFVVTVPQAPSATEG